MSWRVEMHSGSARMNLIYYTTSFRFSFNSLVRDDSLYIAAMCSLCAANLKPASKEKMWRCRSCGEAVGKGITYGPRPPLFLRSGWPGDRREVAQWIQSWSDLLLPPLESQVVGAALADRVWEALTSTPLLTPIGRLEHCQALSGAL